MVLGLLLPLELPRLLALEKRERETRPSSAVYPRVCEAARAPRVPSCRKSGALSPTDTAMATDGAVMFTDEELSEIAGLRRGEGYIEVTCGCTSRRYGDAVGRLRVFASGDLEISCDCTPGCQEGKLTPAEFEKHSGRETPRRWKCSVWVIVKGAKVALLKTPLLRYHNQAFRSGSGPHKGHRSRLAAHRDEFVRCTRCRKERRFRLRTKEECRAHHDALANRHWECSDMPFERVRCEDDEERASRKNYRGCGRSPLCGGCTACVCFGCELCRFADCPCRVCVDFKLNA